MNIYKNKKELIKNNIKSHNRVLDVGFWGQAINIEKKEWVHGILLSITKDLYGVDVNFDESRLENFENYKKQSAENFDFEKKFDVIFAGDIIEHLSNIGLFLDSCKRNLKKNGVLIITTPNTFNLFNILEKILKNEPIVNSDHTMYFNSIVLKKMLEKNGWKVKDNFYLDDAWPKYKQSLKRIFLYSIYKFIIFFTPKFVENFGVIAIINKNEK